MRYVLKRHGTSQPERARFVDQNEQKLTISNAAFEPSTESCRVCCLNQKTASSFLVASRLFDEGFRPAMATENVAKHKAKLAKNESFGHANKGMTNRDGMELRLLE